MFRTFLLLMILPSSHHDDLLFLFSEGSVLTVYKRQYPTYGADQNDGCVLSFVGFQCCDHQACLKLKFDGIDLFHRCNCLYPIAVCLASAPRNLVGRLS